MIKIDTSDNRAHLASVLRTFAQIPCLWLGTSDTLGPLYENVVSHRQKELP
jgi:hypothetical protein